MTDLAAQVPGSRKRTCSIEGCNRGATRASEYRFCWFDDPAVAADLKHAARVTGGTLTRRDALPDVSEHPPDLSDERVRARRLSWIYWARRQGTVSDDQAATLLATIREAREAQFARERMELLKHGKRGGPQVVIVQIPDLTVLYDHAARFGALPAVPV